MYHLSICLFLNHIRCKLGGGGRLEDFEEEELPKLVENE